MQPCYRYWLLLLISICSKCRAPCFNFLQPLLFFRLATTTTCHSNSRRLWLTSSSLGSGQAPAPRCSAKETYRRWRLRTRRPASEFRAMLNCYIPVRQDGNARYTVYTEAYFFLPKKRTQNNIRSDVQSNSKLSG
jgi:hypothetical protein